MIVIADSGSTKTDWVFIENNKPLYFQTDGLNPLFADFDKVQKQLAGKTAFAGIIDAVYFFGAGCGTPESCDTIKRFVRQLFPKAFVLVETDLFGAAFSLCGNIPGMIGIMGTGVNSCWWNGKRIETSAISLGFIIGDEGSGCYLGKQLIKLFFRNQLPDELMKDFEEMYSPVRAEVLESLYKKKHPNRFLAGFAPFWKKHENDEFVKIQLQTFFKSYIDSYVAPILPTGETCFSLIGSIAFHFRDHLVSAAKNRHLKLEQVSQQPIHALADRYCSDPYVFADLFN